VNDPRSKPGKVRIGSAKTVQVNSGFLRRCTGRGITNRWFVKRVTWREAEEYPSLSVICQPSGGLAIFARYVLKSRINVDLQIF
jgi:hypothetical protein